MANDLSIQFLLELYIEGKISDDLLTEKIRFRKAYTSKPKVPTKLQLAKRMVKRNRALSRAKGQTFKFKTGKIKATPVSNHTALITAPAGVIKPK